MARQNSFGDMLRMGRERKGLDLSTAARKLRIRPDILRAIEESDFARMPPRGYTSNMVGAYARLVGLNPTEVTRAYRDEAHQFETGRRPMDSRPDRSRSTDSRRPERSSQRPGTRRTEYLDTPRSSRASSQRGGRVPSQPQYTNLVQGRQAPGIVANLGSMLPLVVVGAIIIGLLVLVLVLAFGGDKSPAADDTPTVPISGMPTPAGTSTDSGNNAQGADTPTVEPVAPKNAIFSYSVADGKKAYIEVIVDGKTKEAETYTGPKTEEYPVTGELKFVTTAPEAVTITVDGEKVEPTESSSANGVYHYTLNFDDVLSDWQKANGVKADAQDADADTDSSTDKTSSDEDDSTQSGDDGSSTSGDDENADR
ncbi:helix-turn-helix domain-containing protein [Eggerthellaceae bacterium 24-137]